MQVSPDVMTRLGGSTCLPPMDLLRDGWNEVNMDRSAILSLSGGKECSYAVDELRIRPEHTCYNIDNISWSSLVKLEEITYVLWIQVSQNFEAYRMIHRDEALGRAFWCRCNVVIMTKERVQNFPFGWMNASRVPNDRDKIRSFNFYLLQL